MLLEVRAKKRTGLRDEMERLAKPKTTEMEKEKSKSGQVEPGPLVTEEQGLGIGHAKDYD